jgi:hypothetical protein
MFFKQTNYYSQKSYSQKILRIQHGLYAANFYTERLCFPFLITYFSCSPSQVLFCLWL